MADTEIYSFDDTDAILASLSNFPPVTSAASSSNLNGSSSSTKASSAYGVSPEDIFLQDDDWNTFGRPDFNTAASGKDFTFMNNMDTDAMNGPLDNDIQENPNSIYTSPTLSDASPLNSAILSNNLNHAIPTDGSIPNIKESEEEYDEDEESFNGKVVKKENSSASISLSKTNANNKVGKPKKDRSSHNIIEKKYRTNINTKITALRDAVPSLRIASGDTSTTMNDLEGLSPPSRVNKASVLTKATEYIKHLERKNNNLFSENQHLRQVITSLTTQVQHQRPQQQLYPQFNLSPQQQQQPQPPPIMQQPRSASTYSDQFQPAVNVNGQPLNIVTDQQQHNPNYTSGLPGKILMGGLTTLVGSSLLNGGNDYDYRGLNVFPFLTTPQFALFFNITKFLLISLSLLYIFVPSSSNDLRIFGENKEGKQAENPGLITLENLSNWYALIKELVFIHTGDETKKRVGDSEVLELMNNIILKPVTGKNFFSYFYTLLKLKTYHPTFEVSFGKVAIANLLLAYSDLSSTFGFLEKEISNSSNEIAKTRVSDMNLKYLYKDIKKETKYLASCDTEAFKRLLNISLGLPLNTNCAKGCFDKGYESILKDETVIFDYKQLLSSFRANELFREVLLDYIELTFRDSKYAKLSTDELRETKREVWCKLILSENLASKRSIVDIRIKLLKSILNEKYLDSTLKLVNEESKALTLKQKLNITIDNSNQARPRSFFAQTHLKTASTETDSSSTTLTPENETIETSTIATTLDYSEDEMDFDSDSIYESEEEIEPDENSSTESTETSKSTESANSAESLDSADCKSGKTTPLTTLSSTASTFNTRTASSLSPRFTKLLSQDLFNALVSATILKYSKSNHRSETSKLLRYLQLNKNEISLLSFISMFKLVQKYPKSWMKNSEDAAKGQFNGDSEIIESIVANLRLWIGDLNIAELKDQNDDLQIKREISDKLVQVGKSFGYY